MAKYLIFETSTEFQSQVAVIEWTEALAGRIAVLCDAVDQQNKTQEDLSEVRYMYHAPMFSVSGRIDGWLQSSGLDEVLRDDRFVFADELSDEVLEESRSISIDSSELCIVPGKAFYWEIYAKHAQAVVQTQLLYIESNLELFDMWITR